MAFVDFPLLIINPAFDSPLTGEIIHLDHLRRLNLKGDTPPHIFFQLKEIFHLLESLESARIEGNRTTIAEYVDTKIIKDKNQPESIWELTNIEKAMGFIEDEFRTNDKVSKSFICNLHALTVRDLGKEGDPNPGAYRSINVAIQNAPHEPPPPRKIEAYMDELLKFINMDDEPRYDLLKIAIAHHRFTWIHPFRNGNGRVVRLLTYALLIRSGFNVSNAGRILNPTAVFCNDREKYYDMLSLADSGVSDKIEEWCYYMLSGMRHELDKLDQLTDYDFVRNGILLPALDYCYDRHIITDLERKILRIAISKHEIKAQDIKDTMPHLNPRQRNYQLKKLVGTTLLQPIEPNARTYTLNFMDNALMRGIFAQLRFHGFTSTLD